jgi:hypothetical protein
MSTLQVDNINSYSSSSVTFSGSINTENLTFINFESPVQGQLVIKPRAGNGYASIGMENYPESIDIYSYELTSSLSIGNNNGFLYQYQIPGEPEGQYYQLQFTPEGVLNAPTSQMGGQGKFALTANSGIVQSSPDDITITDQTASFDVRNGNFFTITLATDVDNRFEFSELDGGQTIDVLVTIPGTTTTVSFDTSLVKQLSGSSYTPTIGGGKDILTFKSFNNSGTIYLTSVVKDLI